MEMPSLHLHCCWTRRRCFHPSVCLFFWCTHLWFNTQSAPHLRPATPKWACSVWCFIKLADKCIVLNLHVAIGALRQAGEKQSSSEDHTGSYKILIMCISVEYLLLLLKIALCKWCHTQVRLPSSMEIFSHITLPAVTTAIQGTKICSMLVGGRCSLQHILQYFFVLSQQ